MDLTKVDFKPILDSAKSSEDGLAVFLRTIQPYVMNKARYILGSNEAAEDIYQNVSLKLYNNLDHIDSRGFMSYLKRTVTNACNDELRKGHKLTDDGEEVKLVSLDEYEDWDIPAEDQTFDLTEDYRNTVVNEVIDSLPENQREVIVLRYMDDLKIRDIANELNVNENTIKSRLNLAYKKIEQQINVIQKRDGIRLHSYTPIMFFLMLFKRGEGAYVGDILKPMEIASEIYGVLKGTNIVAEGIKHVAGEAASKTIPTPPPAPTPPAAPVPIPDPATTVGVGGKALGSLTVGKVAAGVAAASVALTGGYYAVNHFNDFVLL
ncbi:MAG: sigma-70 family RNA polymerase sigma factor, partial [Solobacterium sp.]|nr:sigma-70 family RNA polymerase sigma factor [Solobacterium sp.]